MATILASFVEKFTGKYNSDSDSKYIAKIKIDQQQAKEELQNLIDTYNLFDENFDSENITKSPLEAKLEQQIEKYTVSNLHKKLKEIKSEEELKDLIEEYTKAFEEITPLSAVKNKRHMKEYIGIFAALKILQKLSDTRVELVDMQKQFEVSFKQQMRELRQQRLQNARTNQISKSKNVDQLSSLLLSSLAKIKNAIKETSGNIAFIMANSANQTSQTTSGSSQKTINSSENIANITQIKKNERELSKEEKTVNSRTDNEITRENISEQAFRIENVNQTKNKIFSKEGKSIFTHIISNVNNHTLGNQSQNTNQSLRKDLQYAIITPCTHCEQLKDNELKEFNDIATYRIR